MTTRHSRSGTLFAHVLVITINILLILYDTLSWPVYYIIQRPDRRSAETKQLRSERVDESTWIRTTNSIINKCHESKDSICLPKRRKSFMGATLDEIFGSAIGEFRDRICLGYRAVVTCPVFVWHDDKGNEVMQDRSFRSDYTWYTYEQIGRRVLDLASGLHFERLHPGSRALFVANTSLEWFCAAQACFQLACQLVIAPDITNATTMTSILKEAEIDIIFASCDKLHILIKMFEALSKECAGTIHVRHIVIIDWQFSVDFNEPAFARVRRSTDGAVDKILSIGQIEEIGAENPIEIVCTKYLIEEQGLKLESNAVTGCVFTSPDSTSTDVTSELPKMHCVIGSLNLFGTTRASASCEKIKIRDRRYSVETSPISSSIANTTQRGRRMRLGSSPRLSLQELVRTTGDRIKTKPEDVAVIVYTSGAMGQIQALTLTHSNLARCGNCQYIDGIINSDVVHCSMLPLDNLIEFMTEICVLSRGGCIGYSNSLTTLFYDGKALFKNDKSDLESLNPNFLLVRPFILESLKASIQEYLNLMLNPLMSFMMTNILYEYKKYWASKHLSTPLVDWLFCTPLKNLFGTNLKYILCNGDVECLKTKEFFAFMLNINVIELHGPEEALASLMSIDDDVWYSGRRAAGRRCYNWRHLHWEPEFCLKNPISVEEECDDLFNCNIQLLPPTVNRNTFKEDRSRNLLATSSIFAPTFGARIRLEDWEDFRSDDSPYPRGRLVIGGDFVCSEYFKRPELSRQSFYTDANSISWFRTDDIVRVFPNGSFEIISAISDIMQMSDGQFISLSQIELILRNSQFLDNCCAICDKDRKFVIVLVVPNLRRLALKSPSDADLQMAITDEPEPGELNDIEFRREVCNDRLLCEFVSKHLGKLLAQAGLDSVAKSFMLVPEIWTPESELVTSAYKPRRGAIQKYYASDIQSIYKLRLSVGKKRLAATLSEWRRLVWP